MEWHVFFEPILYSTYIRPLTTYTLYHKENTLMPIINQNNHLISVSPTGLQLSYGQTCFDRKI